MTMTQERSAENVEVTAGAGAAPAAGAVDGRPASPPSPPSAARRPPPDATMIKNLGLGRGARVRHLVWRVSKYLMLAAVVALVGWAVLRSRRPAAPPGYLTAPVTRGDLRVVVAATGRVQAATTVEVGAEVSGRILRLLVDDNDKVSRGQLLAEIDPEQLKAALAQQQAQLASARAAVRQALATELEQTQLAARTTALADQALIARQSVESNQASLERARAAHQVAVANEQLAVAGVQSARSRLDKATIRSPIDGIVLARLMEPGQTVTAGFTTPVLFKLAEDLTRMTLRVDVDEADVGRVRAGNPAAFTVDSYPGREFASRVVALRNEPKIAQNVVTYEAELEVDNRELLLRPGMTATATIVTEVRSAALLVPNAALRFLLPGTTATAAPAGSGTVWQLVAPAGKPGGAAAPRAVPLQIGASDGTNTEVLGGALAVGALVVVDLKEAP